MLTQFTLLDALTDRAPGFRPQYAAFVDEYGDPDNGRPLYLLMGDLVVACGAMLRDGRQAEVQALFDLVEEGLREGDKYVHDLMIVGFIEDLQNTNLHRGTRPDDFLSFLGPESRRAWDKVAAFWTKREPISRD